MKVIFRNFFMTLRRFKLASILNVLGLSVAFAHRFLLEYGWAKGKMSSE